MKVQRRLSSLSARTPNSSRAAVRRLGILELLEARTMLSAYIVTSGDDSGTGTLRDAIAQIHASPTSSDSITFAPGLTISLNSSVQLLDTVTITGPTNANHQPEVQITTTTGASSAFVVDAAGVTISGLSIGGFAGAGIVFESGGSDTLQGNFIGLDTTGTNKTPNGTGVSILSNNNLLVGNVISGNSNDGIDLTGDSNRLKGNFIGTGGDGNAILDPNDSTINLVSNGGSGVFVNNASNTVIGGLNSSDCNYIVGNHDDGVLFTSNAAAGNLLQNNYIGVDISGNAAGNQLGVEIVGDSTADSSHITIDGNLISANAGPGIQLSFASFNTIRGNFIGVDPSGLTGPTAFDFPIFGNSGIAVNLQAGSHDNLIGGPSAGDGNLIAGNGTGVKLDGGRNTFNTVQGNQIGLDASFAQDENGVGVRAHSGQTLITGNVISGNGDGIWLESTGAMVFGNWIGTDQALDPNLGNFGNGVFVIGSNNVIGGTDPGQANVIAYNGGAGVLVNTGTGNAIRGNSIYANFGLGIGLADPSTPQLNDHDGHAGNPNLFQNFPVISSITGSQGHFTVTGTLQVPLSQSNTTFLLDFFTNSVADSSGYGEGETYLGSPMSVTTDANGNATFTANFSNVPVGQTYWSATATDGAGNTSEFALDVASVITAPNKAGTTTGIASSLNPSTFGQSVTFTATVTPGGGTMPLMGTISFIVNNTVMKSVTLDGTGNSGTWTANFFGGDTAVIAVYSGDDNYITSQSMLTQTVNRAATITTILSSQNPTNYGQAVTFMATVTGQAGNGVVPTGTVTFMDNGAPIGTVTLNASGMASLTTASLTIGSHSISVMYNSDGNYAASSGSMTQTINAAGGTISGHTYFDVTGNGLSSDDRLMGGITIKLFFDKNGNGTLDSGDGAAIKTIVSDNSGAYTFGGIMPGKYFVQEVTPGGYVRTAPTNSTYYTDVMTSGLVIASNDFDNYQTGCCCNSLTGVKFVINGRYTYSDLRGHVHQGDTVQVQFTVLSGHTDLLSLVSYTAPGSSFDANTASQQQVYQAASGVFGPGYHTMTVVVPRCFFQIDFVCGSVIDHFGPAGSNMFYSAQDRLLSADNGGYTPPPAH